MCIDEKRNHLVNFLRSAATLLFGFLIFMFGAAPMAKSESYDVSEIENHLREIYKYHGDALFRWQRPIYYIVAGLESEATKQLVDDQFAYLSELTGLDIQEADPAEANGNFLLVFASPMAQIAEVKSLRAIFGEAGESDAEYRERLEDLDKYGRQSRTIKRTSESIAFFAVLTDPTSWKEELVGAHFLRLIVQGLTQTSASDRIRPSVLNAVNTLQPSTRLPSFDEAYLKALYGERAKSDRTMEESLRELALATALELNN